MLLPKLIQRNSGHDRAHHLQRLDLILSFMYSKIKRRNYRWPDLSTLMKMWRYIFEILLFTFFYALKGYFILLTLLIWASPHALKTLEYQYFCCSESIFRMIFCKGLGRALSFVESLRASNC